jgi:hypothetical protein
VLVLVFVLASVSTVAAEPVPAPGHVPRYAVGLGLNKVNDDYETLLVSLELARRLSHHNWLELGLATGTATETKFLPPELWNQSLYEGRVGIARVHCVRFVCGGARASIGYLRHELVEPAISDWPWVIRRHRWFGEARLLGRVDVASWAAFEVSFGVRQSYATVHRDTDESAFGTVVAIGLSATL